MKNDASASNESAYLGAPNYFPFWCMGDFHEKTEFPNEPKAFLPCKKNLKEENEYIPSDVVVTFDMHLDTRTCNTLMHAQMRKRLSQIATLSSKRHVT